MFCFIMKKIKQKVKHQNKAKIIQRLWAVPQCQQKLVLSHFDKLADST